MAALHRRRSFQVHAQQARNRLQRRGSRLSGQHHPRRSAIPRSVRARDGLRLVEASRRSVGVESTCWRNCGSAGTERAQGQRIAAGRWSGWAYDGRNRKDTVDHRHYERESRTTDYPTARAKRYLDLPPRASQHRLPRATFDRLQRVASRWKRDLD